MKKLIIPMLGSLLLLAACNNSTEEKKESSLKEPKLKTESVTYSPADNKDSLVMDGYIAWDENIEGKRPAVLVVHEWWGMNDYVKRRVRELAGLGYIAMAVDFYGNGKRADNPTDAGKLATPFYQDPQMAKQRFDAALATLRGYSQTDTTKIAAIGYCFGGTSMVFIAAALGIVFQLSRFTEHKTIREEMPNANLGSRRGIGRTRYASRRGNT